MGFLHYRFQDRLEPCKDTIPEAVRKVIEEELSKLSGLEQASSEFNVTRNYLDWLTLLPWGKHSEERLDIDHAKQVGLPDTPALQDLTLATPVSVHSRDILLRRLQLL